MAGTIAVEDFRKAYLAVLETVVAHSRGFFLEPGASLFETLADVSAEEASRPLGGHGSTLAAQVAHVRVYIAARNDELRTGGEVTTDWPAAWQTGAVTAEEWQGSLAGLRAAYDELLARTGAIETWDEWSVADAFAIVGHCAYHLGEIRQALGLLRG